jgi:pimeloyl-ACP methyl ester carboxylesterase
MAVGSRSAHAKQSGRAASIRRKRPFPRSSPHSAQTESRTIQKTTISSRRDVFSALALVTCGEFESIARTGRSERRDDSGAFALAETMGGFQVDAVSPVRAAARITAPVLLVHGARDVATPPGHSRREYAVLNGPKRLIIVDAPGTTRRSHGARSGRQSID